jgi:hypothetical protein
MRAVERRRKTEPGREAWRQGAVLHSIENLRTRAIIAAANVLLLPRHPVGQCVRIASNISGVAINE